MPDVDLTYEYKLPGRQVYDWWTDVSGKGYVGKSLKEISLSGKEHGTGKSLVNTRWKIMGMNMKMMEKLTLEPPNHWIWEPHMMGIQIDDDFHLIEDNGKRVTLHIVSNMHPKGTMGKMAYLIIGWYLRRLMRNEWDAADRAFREEIAQNHSNKSVNEPT